MRPLARLGAALALVAAFGAPAAGAVADYLGKPVAAVRVLVEGRETVDPSLQQVIETPAGQPLSMAQVRESIEHLFSLGRFDDVRVDATLEDGRVVLQYLLSPVHPVDKISFTGPLRGTGIDVGALRRAVTDRYGQSPPLGRTADMTRIVTTALGARGYLHARVTPSVQLEHARERATLSFAVTPGARTSIGTIDVTGAVPDRAQLLDRLGLQVGRPYERGALDARIERYVEDRRREGFYEARIDPVVRFTDDDRVAHLTLAVSPGPRVQVVFAGDPLPADRRDEMVPVEREGSVDEDLLEDSSNRIEEYFRNQGYRDASAPHEREETERDLRITFTVTRGPLYRVARVEVSGNAATPIADLGPVLRVQAGQPFADSRLDADVSAIEDFYHRRGFASARASAAVELQRSPAASPLVLVTVRIVVAEGARTLVDAVTFAGNRALSDAALRARIALRPGAPFVPGQLASDRDAIEQAYQNLGYRNASVDVRPAFNAGNTRATVQFAVREGPRLLVDHVLIVGNVRTSTETIEHELQLGPGDPLSLSAENESQRRLAALGLFRRATITELAHGDETTRDLLVTIEEAPATTIGYGGGLEGRLRPVRDESGGVVSDRFEIAPRASFDYGRRNLFGKNRSLNLFTSASLLLVDRGTGGDSTPGEYLLGGTFREPRLFNTPADALANVTIEQQVRSTFNFTRRSATLDVARHLTPTLSATGTYQIQRTRLFGETASPSDQLLIDRTFPQFRLSSFSASIIRDTRNDQLEPSGGHYVSASGQLAARGIGSEFGFLKSFFTAQAFRTLPHTRRIVFAGDARLGMAAGFPHEALDADGNVLPGVAITDLPQSERFYAGGDTTIRGFAIDRVGTHHVPAQPNDTLDPDLLPKGGNGLVIFNAELRAPVWGGLGVVGFFDTGNVFARIGDIDLAELRSAAGGGIRYKSPVGPIRIDLGFKVNRQPGEALTAWFVSFGQAF